MGLAGLDRFSEIGGMEGLVADESNVTDAGPLTFLHFEYEIAPIVAGGNDLGLDRHVEATRPTIKLHDLLHVALDDRARQRPPFFRLRFLLELLVLDLLVALERNALDDAVLDHLHDDAAIAARD